MLVEVVTLRRNGLVLWKADRPASVLGQLMVGRPDPQRVQSRRHHLVAELVERDERGHLVRYLLPQLIDPRLVRTTPTGWVLSGVELQGVPGNPPTWRESVQVWACRFIGPSPMPVSFAAMLPPLERWGSGC